ncbi:hypothetical protein BDA99DRAFT_574429 [Phascolomyces articulosus]|uniref:Uncharacterized protein n=1 Tax=Phascolomyces articulosus TaxID=60185 RepID=A0AAD5JU49_9FUNG|nr:hypothetical protein BDA99DRAFT_574429 [Phascolomyces articulosus]
MTIHSFRNTIVPNAVWGQRIYVNALAFLFLEEIFACCLKDDHDKVRLRSLLMITAPYLMITGFERVLIPIIIKEKEYVFRCVDYDLSYFDWHEKRSIAHNGEKPTNDSSSVLFTNRFLFETLKNRTFESIVANVPETIGFGYIYVTGLSGN